MRIRVRHSDVHFFFVVHNQFRLAKIFLFGTLCIHSLSSDFGCWLCNHVVSYTCKRFWLILNVTDPLAVLSPKNIHSTLTRVNFICIRGTMTIYTFVFSNAANWVYNRCGMRAIQQSRDTRRQLIKYVTLKCINIQEKQQILIEGFTYVRDVFSGLYCEQIGIGEWVTEATKGHQLRTRVYWDLTRQTAGFICFYF